MYHAQRSPYVPCTEVTICNMHTGHHMYQAQLSPFVPCTVVIICTKHSGHHLYQAQWSPFVPCRMVIICTKHSGHLMFREHLHSPKNCFSFLSLSQSTPDCPPKQLITVMYKQCAYCEGRKCLL